MLDFFKLYLDLFRDCFSYLPSFHTFVWAVLAFITSPAPHTVSALVQALSLKANCYDQLVKFFKEGKWDLDQINFILIKLIFQSAPLYTLNDRIVLIGDGCKVPSDAYKFPSLSKEICESQSASKLKSASKSNGYFKGLNFEGIAFLGQNKGHFFALPAWTRIVAGNKEILEWQAKQHLPQPKQMAIDACRILDQLKASAYLVLDRYYLSKSFLETIRDYNQSHQNKLHGIFRVKKNIKVWIPYTAPQKRSRGRPKLIDYYSLNDAFEDYKDQFETLTVFWNKRRVTIQVLCFDHFFWGDRKDPHSLRLVLVKSPKGNVILASTDHDLTPKDMIETYSLRFQIEVSFKNQKEQFGTFSGRFSCQALERFNLSDSTSKPTARVKKQDRKKVIETLRAHEAFALLSLIAYDLCEIYRCEYMSTPECRLIYRRTYGIEFSLSETKEYLSQQIKSKIGSEDKNWLNEMIFPKTTEKYYPKKYFIRSKEQLRVIRR